VVGHIAGDDGTRADQGSLSDRDAAENDGSTADGCTALYARGNDLPVIISLQSPVGCGAWIQIVDEHHTVSDKNVVFDGYAFANEGVGGNLAATSNEGIFLHFDEGADLGFIADSAAIKVDQIGLEDFYIVPKDHVGGNWHEGYCIRRICGIRYCGRTNPTDFKKEQDAQYNRSQAASTATKMMLFCVVELIERHGLSKPCVTA